VSPGDVILLNLAQAGGGTKLRPALILSSLPGPYQNFLLCGISTQLHQLEPNWDERIHPVHPDFVQSGLRQESAARLSYLIAVAASEIIGTIGQVDSSRLDRLRTRLADRLRT
jgi:mRNA interferase MazF